MMYQISQGAKLTKVRDKAFEADTNLAKVIDCAHNQEIVAGRKSVDVKPYINTVQEQDRRCTRCGSMRHFASDKRCNARNMRCNNCGGMGHYARICRKLQVATTINRNRSTFNNNNNRAERSTFNAKRNDWNNNSRYGQSTFAGKKNEGFRSQVNYRNEESDGDNMYEV